MNAEGEVVPEANVNEEEEDNEDWNEEELDEEEEDEIDYDEDEDLSSPLIAAAEAGDFATVQSLLAQGADMNESANHGSTALIRAATRGHLAIVKLLVEQGADIEKVDHSEGSREVVRYLLEQGADRDKAAYEGYTPLHWAAGTGDVEKVKVLMAYGADLNAKKCGYPPIDMPDITEEIKQAIRDEPRRRLDEAPGKRATEQDRHPNTATSACVEQDEEEAEEVDEQVNKRPRFDEGEAKEGMVAEEDQDSEPSSDREE